MYLASLEIKKEVIFYLIELIICTTINFQFAYYKNSYADIVLMFYSLCYGSVTYSI